MQPNDAIGSARNIGGIDGVGAGIERGLHWSKRAGLNGAHARQNVVVEPSDARCRLRQVRIVNLGIDAAEAVAGVTIPQVAFRLAGELADGRARQDHTRGWQSYRGQSEGGEVLSSSPQGGGGGHVKLR